MADKIFRVRPKSDGQASPTVDGMPVDNEILLSLSAKERDLIFPQLTFMELRTHTVLHESGEPIKFGYFLNKGLASVLTVLTEGKSVEVGLTGKDGFVGLPLIVGFSTSPTRTVIQIEAAGFRINAKNLVQVMRQSPGLVNRLQRYVQILGMQGTQVAACNRLQFRGVDPGISGAHAGHAPGQRNRGCGHPAEGRADYLPARARQYR